MILVDVVIGTGPSSPAQAGEARALVGAGFLGLDLTLD